MTRTYRILQRGPYVERTAVKFDNQEKKQAWEQACYTSQLPDIPLLVFPIKIKSPWNVETKIYVAVVPLPGSFSYVVWTNHAPGVGKD